MNSFRLLCSKPPNCRRIYILFGMVLVGTATAGVTARRCEPTQQKSPEAEKQMERCAWISDGSRWLDSAVRYIATPQERIVYQTLITEEQRKRFIKRFWRRRNPHPGSSPNSFKKEFYERVIYADQRFKVKYRFEIWSDPHMNGIGRRVSIAIPGWKTDRGRIYIIYGPPDHITHKDFPLEPFMPHSYEVWTYRHPKATDKNLSVTFIDRWGYGNYEVAPGTAE